MYVIHEIIENLSDNISMYSGNEKELIIDLIVELWTKEIYLI